MQELYQLVYKIKVCKDIAEVKYNLLILNRLQSYSLIKCLDYMKIVAIVRFKKI